MMGNSLYMDAVRGLVSERFFEFLESAHRAFLSVSPDNFKLLCVDSI
jgi:hypothetical protein